MTREMILLQLCAYLSFTALGIYIGWGHWGKKFKEERSRYNELIIRFFDEKKQNMDLLERIARFVDRPRGKDGRYVSKTGTPTL